MGRHEVRSNLYSDRDAFQTKFEKSLPEWWPRFPSGEIARYVYHALDVDHGRDVQYPSNMQWTSREEYATAIRHRLVDFTAIDIKKEAIRQLGGGIYPYDQRFVSTSLGMRALGWYKQASRSKPQSVRIDLLALWEDGLFTETSFVDVSTKQKFAVYFLGDENTLRGSNLDLPLSIEESQRVCAGNFEVLIGIRGSWWPPYAVLINENGEVMENQVGGWKNIRFGDTLLDKFQGKAQSANSHRDPVHRPRKSNRKPTNDDSALPSDKKKRRVPPWRESKRSLTPPRRTSPKAGSPPTLWYESVKAEEVDWGGHDLATPGTPPGTPGTPPRIQPEAPSQTQSGAP